MAAPKLLFTILGAAVCLAPCAVVNPQVSEATAREQARSVVRSQLNFGPDKFLQIQRDEKLEQSLALIVARPSWMEFIYGVKPEGYEIKTNAVVQHLSTDAHLRWIIAISPLDGSAYRVRGFKDSLDEFNKLMTAAKLKVVTTDQAEDIAHFYREVNPGQFAALNPIYSLIGLKQAAERQCQVSTFDEDEKAFDAWWKHAKPLYQYVPFTLTTAPHGSSYYVEWIALSSAGPGSCGGVPFRARLEVKPDGTIEAMTFLPVRKS